MNLFNIIVRTVFSGFENERLLEIAESISLYHHEKYDRRGYPNGLKDKEIPLEASIIAIANIYNVLVSSRCYKTQMSQEEAYNIIKDSMGTHFDRNLRDCFEKAFPEISW